ncbi:MAG: PEGA domain-containing protein [Lachnospiraceae bacterium]
MAVCVLLLLCSLGLLACSNKVENQEAQVAAEQENPIITLAAGAYDSGDTAILVEKQENRNQLVFLNLIKGKEYYLEYNGSSRFYDKYGSAVSVSQLAEGEVVEIQFLKENRMLSSLKASDKVWTMDGVSKFELDRTNGKIKIMDEWYNLSQDALIFSEGKKAELMDVNAEDILQIRGVEHEVYSIVIEKGHGYLRLTNDEYFIGGWIEVGQKVIRRIEEDMLLVVPEGSYEVYLSHYGIEGMKQVEILRNKESLLDVGDIRKDDLVKYGTLIFTVEPAAATVYLDGKSVDTSRTVKAEYGLHQVMAKAEGYQTVIQYIKVSQTAANVSIILDKEKDRTVSSNSAVTTTSGNSAGAAGNTNNKTNSSVSGNTSSTATAGYKISIDAPKGAEVYLDGSYIGIVPTSFNKKAGTYQITLRKSGYKPKTYTIELDQEQTNYNYSFLELEAAE